MEHNPISRSARRVWCFAGDCTFKLNLRRTLACRACQSPSARSSHAGKLYTAHTSQSEGCICALSVLTGPALYTVLAHTLLAGPSRALAVVVVVLRNFTTKPYTQPVCRRMKVGLRTALLAVLWLILHASAADDTAPVPYSPISHTDSVEGCVSHNAKDGLFKPDTPHPRVIVTGGAGFIGAHFGQANSRHSE